MAELPVPRLLKCKSSRIIENTSAGTLVPAALRLAILCLYDARNSTSIIKFSSYFKIFAEKILLSLHEFIHW